jgi:hypothetical protein
MGIQAFRRGVGPKRSYGLRPWRSIAGRRLSRARRRLARSAPSRDPRSAAPAPGVPERLCGRLQPAQPLEQALEISRARRAPPRRTPPDRPPARASTRRARSRLPVAALHLPMAYGSRVPSAAASPWPGCGVAGGGVSGRAAAEGGRWRWREARSPAVWAPAAVAPAWAAATG